MTLLVTGYTDPDLDGTACAVAYAEFLEATGRPAVAALFGTPQQEARFVLQRYGLPLPADAERLIDDCEGVILVDASDTRGISSRIDREKVVELIDHRPLHEAGAFPRATPWIEWVGAAATLVARRFRTYPLAISPGAAALLYHAIAANTIVFQAGVTTAEDREAADWLLDRFDGPPCVDEMFADKSRVRGPLRIAFEPLFGSYPLAGATIGIVQWEALDVGRFVDRRLVEIEQTLAGMQQAHGVEAILLTCIDVREGYNLLVAFDEPTRQLLRSALGVRFDGPLGRRPGVLMRKEIVPLLAEALGE